MCGCECVEMGRGGEGREVKGGWECGHSMD